jgi:hypothetical protein
MKDTSISNHFPHSTTLFLHKRDVSSVSNGLNPTGPSDYRNLKESTITQNPNDISPFPHSICSSINQQVSNLPTEMHELIID